MKVIREVKIYSGEELDRIFEQLLKENEDVLIRLKNADDTTYKGGSK